LVISDVIMPKMGGLALLQSLRERGWARPFILMTGHPLDTSLSELQAQGVYMTLTKPIGSATLAQTVTSVLGQK
jgi:DNA-binding NtrC family response regulator